MIKMNFGFFDVILTVLYFPYKRGGGAFLNIPIIIAFHSQLYIKSIYGISTAIGNQYLNTPSTY